MHQFNILKDLVIILAFGVVIVALFQRWRIPAIAGLMLAGMLVGPHGLGLIDSVHEVEILAEFGVALLLFSIGLELSLEKLKRLWKLVLIGGFVQVVLTIGVTVLIATAFGQTIPSAIFIGFLIALSSTAIVSKGLQQRGEVDAPHGRLILGILVFQDLAVIPMMLTIPILLGGSLTIGSYLLTPGEALLIIAAVLAAATFLVPRLLTLVARTRQRQLFILSVFVICIGTAWIITSAGASLAIGAFLAGLVVAGSDYRHQAMSDLLSFKEVFSSLFFVSIGMFLQGSLIADNLPIILSILAAILIGKAVVVFVAASILRMPSRVCFISSLALAQVGEFAFVLLFAVLGSRLIPEVLESNIMAAAILSMFLAPFALDLSPRLAAGLGRSKRFKRFFGVAEVSEITEQLPDLCGHVIVGGYGFAGRQLARALRSCGIPYVVVDMNLENVRDARKDGEKALFGDMTSQEVLEELNMEHAAELVLLLNDPAAAEQAVRVARRQAPNIHIVVRTHYLLDIKSVESAGANLVIPAERAAAIAVTSALLRRHAVEEGRIDEACAAMQGESEENEL